MRWLKRVGSAREGRGGWCRMDMKEEKEREIWRHRQGGRERERKKERKREGERERERERGREGEREGESERESEARVRSISGIGKLF